MVLSIEHLPARNVKVTVRGAGKVAEVRSCILDPYRTPAGSAVLGALFNKQFFLCNLPLSQLRSLPAASARAGSLGEIHLRKPGLVLPDNVRILRARRQVFPLVRVA